MPLSAIGAAFFVTLPSQVPNSVRAVHILALIIPVIYAFVLTQRQRQAATARQPAGGPARAARRQGDGDRDKRPAPGGPAGAAGAGSKAGAHHGRTRRQSALHPAEAQALPRRPPATRARPTRAANGGAGPPTPTPAPDT